MDRGVGAAVRPLSESDRKDLAIQALAGSETVSDLAARHGMSRKFVYQQTHKARAALDDAFSPVTPDEAVLFELAVSKTWLRQVIVGLTLICRSSYRGVMEFLRDLLGLPVSVGHVHDVLQAVTRQASAVNGEQDLSGIRVGLHDEIFQGATPVLAGVDARSTSRGLAQFQRGSWPWLAGWGPSGLGSLLGSRCRELKGLNAATQRSLVPLQRECDLSWCTVVSRSRGQNGVT